MSSAREAVGSRHDVPPEFGRIVCGIDASRTSPVAAEQAIALSGAGTALVFVCVREERGAGATHQATIAMERARTALERAVHAAHEAGVDASAEILPGNDPGAVLLDQASRADLLVVASHGRSRVDAIVLGSTAAAAVHHAEVPVLVARRPPQGVEFPREILVASDGSPGAGRPVELAARIGRAHRSDVYLLSVDPHPHGDPRRLATEIADLTAALGRRPTVIRERGKPSERIVQLASSERVSLVVLGSRGLTGIRAVESVSERVAQDASCSVLVAR
jgi:nucleotide-binding universal stress UspA family protein